MKDFVYQQLTKQGFTVTNIECEIIAARLEYANGLKKKTAAATLKEAPIALTYHPERRDNK